MTLPPTSATGGPGGSGNNDPGLPRWARKRPQESLLTDERMSAFIGPKWDRVYRKKLAPFLEDAAFVPTWNWSAAFAFPLGIWFLYRKLYLAFALFFLVPRIAFSMLTGADAPLTMDTFRNPENQWLAKMFLAVMVSSALAAGGTANWFLFRRARVAARLISMQQLPNDESLALLTRIGGVNRRGSWFFLLLWVVLTAIELRG